MWVRGRRSRRRAERGANGRATRGHVRVARRDRNRAGPIREFRAGRTVRRHAVDGTSQSQNLEQQAITSASVTLNTFNIFKIRPRQTVKKAEKTERNQIDMPPKGRPRLTTNQRAINSCQKRVDDGERRKYLRRNETRPDEAFGPQEVPRTIPTVLTRRTPTKIRERGPNSTSERGP